MTKAVLEFPPCAFPTINTYNKNPIKQAMMFQRKIHVQEEVYLTDSGMP